MNQKPKERKGKPVDKTTTNDKLTKAERVDGRRSLGKIAGHYWRKPLVRVLLVLSLFAGVIYLQYWLAHIALPVELEKSKYSPVNAGLIKQEELIVDLPTRSAPDGAAPPSSSFLTDDGKDFISIDAYFESARLHEDTSRMLRTDPDETEFPSEGLIQIAYSTEGEKKPDPKDGNGRRNDDLEPCRTSISVAEPKGGKMPGELHFYQSQGPGSDHYRYFEMRALGSDVVVTLETSNRMGDDDAPGCNKSLVVGNWSRPLVGPVPIAIVVPDGKSIRFSYAPFGRGQKWSGPESLFEPFVLETSPLGASAVRKVTSTTPSAPAVLRASKVEGRPPLLLKRLLVGGDELQLAFGGEAMIQEKGNAAVTFDLLEFFKRNPLVAGLLAMVDATLLDGLRRAVLGFFRRRSERKQNKTGGRKRRR
jgi:hypothetical protein